MRVVVLDNIGKMEPNQWYNDLLRCPSQCYYHANREGVDYLLYLRWRWDDPWQAHIIKNARDKASMQSDGVEWSRDLFYWKEGFFFEHDDYEKAQQSLLQLFETNPAYNKALKPNCLYVPAAAYSMIHHTTKKK